MAVAGITRISPGFLQEYVGQYKDLWGSWAMLM
jgi:hypothetical protein